MEAGGQGAPLAPLLHRALFRPSGHDGSITRIVLNLGGIANISLVDANGAVSGFDTGPANCLMDGWIQSNLESPFDLDGRWAASGTVSAELLASLLSVFRPRWPN
jgi:anhydro-N-acetylmuramic acid kinase